jgi:hypothetical protein
MMGVFNNLVLFDQHVPQDRVESIVPDLATSWSLSENGTELSFKLRDGIVDRAQGRLDRSKLVRIGLTAGGRWIEIIASN